MNRNPHAPQRALTREEVKPGMKVVIIGGGQRHHERAEIVSKPYTQTVKLATLYDPKTGNVGSASLVFVKVRVPTSNPFRRGGTYVTEKSAADMGLCPDSAGRWSPHYTLRAQDYDPQAHDYVRERPQRRRR